MARPCLVVTAASTTAMTKYARSAHQATRAYSSRTSSVASPFKTSD